MQKQSDPWDDSALLNALNDAITKYKKMHKKETSHNLNEKGENVVKDSGDVSSTPSDIFEEVPVITMSDKKMEKANEPSLVKEDLHSQQVYTETSNVAQEVVDRYTNSQGAETYNNLLSQYYELEEQRQMVLQQLQQTGYWNNQYITEASGQEQVQDLNQQVSYCCPYACPCLATPCSSMPACSFGGASVSKKDIESTSVAYTQGALKLCSLEDDNIVKTAMGAAERAISSINNNLHGDTSEGKITQPETDISVVLNAWYSAGFYTGKYLTEQSNAKGKH